MLATYKFKTQYKYKVQDKDRCKKSRNAGAETLNGTGYTCNTIWKTPYKSR